MLSADANSWLITGITAIILLLLLPGAVESTLAKLGRIDRKPLMGAVQLVIYYIFLFVVLVRAIFGMFFELTGHGTWNSYGVTTRIIYIMYFLVIIFAVAILSFDIIAPKTKMCPKGTRKFCPVSIAMFLGILVFIMPILIIPLYIAMNGGSAPATNPELTLAAVLASMPRNAIYGEPEIVWELIKAGLIDQFDVLEVKQTTPNDCRFIILKQKPSNDVYIVFSGSVSEANWINNFKFFSVPLTTSYLGEPIKSMTIKDHVTTHEGFLKTYNDAQPFVNNFGDPNFLPIQTALINAPKIHYIGHSLGGAVATLATYHMASTIASYGKTYGDISLITFGSPQVLDLNGVSIFDAYVKISTRCVTPFDPVPHALDGQLPHVESLKVLCPYNIFKAFFGFSAHGIETYQEAINSKNIWVFILICLGVGILITILFMAIMWAFQTIVYFASDKVKGKKKDPLKTE